MRRLTVNSDEHINLRKDEIDWFPVDLGGYTAHLIVDDEDFLPTKEDKFKRRRQKRAIKYLET